MKALLQQAQCGCRFDDTGNLVTTCAGHRERVVPIVLQKAKRYAEVVRLPRYRRWLHALARIWR